MKGQSLIQRSLTIKECLVFHIVDNVSTIMLNENRDRSRTDFPTRVYSLVYLRIMSYLQKS